jgi:murein L,D-transpeptidase YcbB/YkuD
MATEHDAELEMKVVVGEAEEHRSPILVSNLDVIIFRPYWNVPLAIQRDELVPKIERDESWVTANNFELLTSRGEPAKEGRPSDDIVSDLSAGRLQLRQRPGPKNALGLVKFQFPNEYGIYMHDTSVRWLFERERRDHSHGCIRVEKATDLAEWVLSGQSGWSRDRIDETINGTETVSVRVKHPIQVVIMYATAAVMENGDVHFFRDIYGEDGKLEQEPGRE